jgi:TonB family protein
MKRSAASRGKLFIILMILLMLLFLVTAQAQNANQRDREETCKGPVYLGSEVTHRATVTSRPIPSMTQEALAHDVHGRVVLEAVLCRTGRVTDLRVVEGLPYGMTEKAVEAVRRIKFTPAEVKWHSVSQKMRFEFGFNESSIGEIGLNDAAGRQIEAVEIVGNRRFSAEEILRRVKTRPGDLLNVQQVSRDLETILATGYFDKAGTRVITEEGVRGGVVIIFETFELPLVREVKFEGLKYLTEAVVLDALLKENIDVRKGAVYDPAKVRSAVRVIRNLLESKGQGNANVEVRKENLTATAIVLTFVIR